MFESTSPIEMVVNRVAAAVAKAWDQARSEQTPVTDEQNAGFLALAYRYLSARQSAVYKLERTVHLREVQQRYQNPPTADDLYGDAREPSRLMFILGAAFVAIFSVGALFALVSVLRMIVENFVPILNELTRFLASWQAIVLVLSAIIPIGIMSIATRLLKKPLEYVFAGIDHAHWGDFQSHSSKQIESERAQILAMIGSVSG